MPRRSLNFEDVLKVARELGDIQETPVSVKRNGTLLAWIPPHKSIEPNTVVFRVDMERRAEMVEAAPDIYYFTDHYANYPAVLVRLSLLPASALKDLLLMAQACKAPKPRRSPRKKKA